MDLNSSVKTIHKDLSICYKKIIRDTYTKREMYAYLVKSYATGSLHGVMKYSWRMQKLSEKQKRRIDHLLSALETLCRYGKEFSDRHVHGFFSCDDEYFKGLRKTITESLKKISSVLGEEIELLDEIPSLPVFKARRDELDAAYQKEIHTYYEVQEFLRSSVHLRFHKELSMRLKRTIEHREINDFPEMVTLLSFVDIIGSIGARDDCLQEFYHLSHIAEKGISHSDVSHIHSTFTKVVSHIV